MSEAPLKKGQPLGGIRVLAVEGFVAGPFASMWLADMGAEVIKIERPDGGDPSRGLAPSKPDASGNPRSLSFARSNRNKKSVVLDLKTDAGLKQLKALISAADVLIENLKPGSLQRLGLGYGDLKKINPLLIYTTISGFGHEDVLPSPQSRRPAFDVITQALSGLMLRPERSDPRPVYLGFPLVDVYAATLAFAGTMMALFERTRTNEGQHVDIAMYDAAITLNEITLIYATALSELPKPGGHAMAEPFGAFLAADGYLALGVVGEEVWRRFVAAIEMPDLLEDQRFLTGFLRRKNNVALRKIVETWLSTRSRVQAAETMLRHGVPAAPVQDVDEVVKDPQAAARQMILTLDDPGWGSITVAGNPIKTSTLGKTPTGSPPSLGQHTTAVLSELIDESDS